MKTVGVVLNGKNGGTISLDLRLVGCRSDLEACGEHGVVAREPYLGRYKYQAICLLEDVGAANTQENFGTVVKAIEELRKS